MAKPPQLPRVAEVVALVRPLIPEISPERLAEIVHSVAPAPLTQRLLELALIKQPGVLEGQHANVPVTVQDLARVLVEEGASRVVLPTCESCGRAVRMPHKTPSGGRHCSRCERNARSVSCASCGRVRPVQRTIDGQRFCRDCWRADPRSFGDCSRCGQHATIIVRRPQLVCLACYTAPVKTCGLCGEPGRVASHLDGRRVCARCYYAMRRPQPCPECTRRVFLTGFMNGQKVCADCAGAPITMACPGCGSIEEIRKHHLCVECRRPVAIQQLLADDAGEIRADLHPLADYLLTHHGKAASLERWLHKSKCAMVLRELADGTLPLTAEAIITRARSGQSVAFLLSLLVRSGVLPELDVESTRFDHWLNGWLDVIEDPEDRLILRRYCTWELLRSARTLRSASSPASGFLRQRAALKYCAAFFREIRSQQETLATFPQRRLDAYLTDSPSQRDALAPFTRWLRKHRLSTVRVKFRSHRLEGRDYASDHRWQMARRFLSAADMDPKTRAAGLLVLLYGIQLTRIVTITRAQVDTNSRPVTLTVGAEPIELPEILGNAMVNLVAASARHPEGWLFPGRNPGKHLTPGPLSRRLRAEGLLTGSARTTALIELTRQMHPRIVSDLLGIMTASAAAWSRLAGGEWSDYPALRSTHA